MVVSACFDPINAGSRLRFRQLQVCGLWVNAAVVLRLCCRHQVEWCGRVDGPANRLFVKYNLNGVYMVVLYFSPTGRFSLSILLFCLISFKENKRFQMIALCPCPDAMFEFLAACRTNNYTKGSPNL